MGFRNDLLTVSGLVAQNESIGITNAATSSTTFVDVGNGTTNGWAPWTGVVIPATKTYLLHVDLTNFYLSVAGGFNIIYFQIAVDGTAPTQLVSTPFRAMSALNTREDKAWRTAVALAAGSHSFKVQWKVDNAAATANMDGFSVRCLTIST